MKTPARLFTLAGVLLGAGALCSFHHAALREQPEPAAAALLPDSPIPTYFEVKVEIREDGLAYAPGATTPFSGDAIELHPGTAPATIAKRTPYLKGKQHGLVTSFTIDGKLREERVYERGRPVQSTVFYPSGTKKYQVALNARDFAEGRVLGWYASGVLCSEGTLDAGGRIHGVERTYDESGALTAEYVRNEGELVQIVWESPDLTLLRHQKSLSADATPVSAFNFP